VKPRPVPGLKNLGPVSRRWLSDVGVRSRADLIRMGPVAAFLRVKNAGQRPSLNLLWALAGAERGLPWNRLPQEAREQLLIELDAAVSEAEAPAPKPAAKAAPRIEKRPLGKAHVPPFKTHKRPPLASRDAGKAK
jgi:hypothetical protein